MTLTETHPSNNNANGNNRDNGIELEALNDKGDKSIATFSSTDISSESNYLSYIQELQNIWKDQPQINIDYKNVSYTIDVPIAEYRIETLATKLQDIGNTFRSKPTKKFYALKDISGTIKPGTLTLVLAPRGHGRSFFLKSLCGLLNGEKQLSGEIKYNGKSYEECLSDGLQIRKLCAYIDQIDCHNSLLTVRETLEIALEHSVADINILNDPKIKLLHAKRVDLMIDLLGLRECQDTIVGNAMIRGISGGQLKRVSIGEMMITNARFLCGDEISTGLDSAVAYDIINSVSKWCKLSGSSAVMALLQPTPEIYALFDNIILLRDGQTVYNGSRTDLPLYLAGLGIDIPSEVDPADFYVEFLTYPKAVFWRYFFKHQKQLKQKLLSSNSNDSEEEKKGSIVASDNKYNTVEVVFHTEDETDGNKTIVEKIQIIHPDIANNNNNSNIDPDSIPLTTERLVAAFQNSQQYKTILNHLNQAKYKSINYEELSDYTKAQYYQENSRSYWYHTQLNLYRQWLLMKRNKALVIPRLMQAIIIGLVLGSLFYQLDTNSFIARLQLILQVPVVLSFNNMSELPASGEAKSVIYKQADHRFYPTSSYVISVVLVHCILLLPEVFIFGSIVYWMAGFDPDGSRYIFFMLIIICIALTMSKLFRLIAYISNNNDNAQQLAGPITAMSLVFAGIIITADKIPDWLIWLFYLSPFSWIVRSLAQSEYTDSRYIITTPGGQMIDKGSNYLSVWEINQDFAYRYASVGYTLGLFILFSIGSSLALKNIRFPLSIGTQRYEDEEENKTTNLVHVRPALSELAKRYASTQKGSRLNDPNNQSGSNVGSSASSALPFLPMNLVFNNINYTVQVPSKENPRKQVNRLLLNNVSGYAEAGSLIALMGSSGAGKTTLMDCIAGRKTAGVLEGDILLNGYKEDKITFNRICGYAEQQDIHLSTQTVREALQFSAKLRLSSSVNDKQREAFITEVLDILELKHLSNRIVGDVNIQGLSPGQLKLLTIGVELVANPSVLFLDEPTSGLDSRSALLVMKVIRKIANTGRTVICTIHQPSAELFFMFDRLLLLKSGGKMVYFGDVGDEGKDLVDYFLNAPIAENEIRPEDPGTMNPASWILEIVGSTAGNNTNKTQPQYDKLYLESDLHNQNTNRLQELSTPKDNTSRLEFTSRFASSFSTQFKLVTSRAFQNYWRNTDFTVRRFNIMLFLGCLFGLLYLQIDDSDQGGLISKMSVQMMVLGFAGVICSASAFPVIYRNRAVFYREQASHMYDSKVYAIALGLVELPFIAVMTILFIVPYYFMTGFEYTAEAFFKYLLAQYLVCLCFNYMGQFWISATPNILVANIVQGLSFNFLFLLSGLSIQANLIATGWKWVYYMLWISKGLIATNISQYQCDYTIPGNDCPKASIIDQNSPTQETSLQPKAAFISYYLDVELTTANYWRQIGWLILTIGVIRILVTLAITKINHLKR